MTPEAGKTYACRSIDVSQRRQSSSGGIYPLLASSVLRRGGVVYAVRYNSEDFHAEHCRVEDENGLPATIGTKYAASVPEGILSEAAQDLADQREVFFVGTPCQCAGLLALLDAKRISREKLLCMDFVCHGVPSGKIWQTYLSQTVPDPHKITAVNMRDKTNGWIEYSMRIDAGDTRVLSSRRENPYLRAFVGNLDLRPSCHECPFKGVHRPTDLTIGDYWGVQRFAPQSYDPDGVSLLLVHSDKGAQNLEEIGAQIHMEEADLGNACKSNPCITASSIRTAKREKFLAMLREGVPFEKAAEQALHRSLLERARGKMQKFAGGRAKSPVDASVASGNGRPIRETGDPSVTDHLKAQAEQSAQANKDTGKPPVLFMREEQCSGCTACEQICPAGAIVIREDEDGFVYPRIVSDRCIGCGRCVRICPVRHPAGWGE